jgi:hypothetical protein
MVIDDGETLQKQVGEPMVVPAKDWPAFANGAFLEGFESLRQQVEEPSDEQPRDES